MSSAVRPAHAPDGAARDTCAADVPRPAGTPTSDRPASCRPPARSVRAASARTDSPPDTSWPVRRAAASRDSARLRRLRRVRRARRWRRTRRWRSHHVRRRAPATRGRKRPATPPPRALRHHHHHHYRHHHHHHYQSHRHDAASAHLPRRAGARCRNAAAPPMPARFADGTGRDRRDAVPKRRAAPKADRAARVTISSAYPPRTGRLTPKSSSPLTNNTRLGSATTSSHPTCQTKAP